MTLEWWSPDCFDFCEMEEGRETGDREIKPAKNVHLYPKVDDPFASRNGSP